MDKDNFKNVCEEHVFAKLFHSLSKDLHDFIHYKYGSHFNPEDKVQEAFIKLWKHCKDVPPEKAKSYLFTIVNNLSLNQAKHLKVVRKHQELPTKDRTNISPEHILEEQQYMERFERALDKLPEGQRVAFLLNRVEGKRHSEIAELLSISRKAVEKRIYTALKKLREDIEEL
jgi:RNA polymerase sigma-70 factor (ECF subfamily)